MFALTIQTGLRISELAALTRQDVTLTAGANVHTLGKGRKERRTPLVPSTTSDPQGLADARIPARPTTRCSPPPPDGGSAATPSNAASPTTSPSPAPSCPSIKAKHVTMHTLRHTAAMRLLIAGNDITVIALWLGHEQIATTNIYLHADMTHKQEAIDRTRPARCQARPLPTPRRAPHLPRGPLIMPTPTRRSPSPATAFATEVGITKRSA